MRDTSGLPNTPGAKIVPALGLRDIFLDLNGDFFLIVEDFKLFGNACNL